MSSSFGRALARMRLGLWFTLLAVVAGIAVHVAGAPLLGRYAWQSSAAGILILGVVGLALAEELVRPQNPYRHLDPRFQYLDLAPTGELHSGGGRLDMERRAGGRRRRFTAGVAAGGVNARRNVDVQRRSEAMAAAAQQELTFAWEGLQLAGTLYLPATPPPHPAVLLLQGSGPADRDGNGYFPLIRDTFLSRGLATFAFDKPGIGASTGDWRDYALRGRTKQALAALQLLREHPALDAHRLGVWGQSQDGWLVQILAADVPEIAFAIANSGAAIDVPTQDLAGCEHTLRAGGASEAEIARALTFVRAVHAAALHGDDYATADAQLLAAARDQPGYAYFGIEDEADWRGLCRFVTEEYDPAATLARIRCPLLAIFGAQDVLVPAWESAQIYSASLRAAENPDATIVIFPRGNHRIQTEQDGPFVEGYLDLLGDWIARRVASE